jgi:hypothetical protein
MEDNGEALETDIRKLKLELMRQELDDKLLTLKAYMKRKNQFNTTTVATTTTDPNDPANNYLRPFSSVLFINVFGEFEVWHLVLITLFIWLMICKRVLLCICNL